MLPHGAPGAVDGPGSVPCTPGIGSEGIRFLLEHPIERVREQSDGVVDQSRLSLSGSAKVMESYSSGREEEEDEVDPCYGNEGLPSARMSGRIQKFPAPEELLDDGSLRVDNAESRDVDGPVFFDSLIPPIIHHLGKLEKGKQDGMNMERIERRKCQQLEGGRDSYQDIKWSERRGYDDDAAPRSRAVIIAGGAPLSLYSGRIDHHPGAPDWWEYIKESKGEKKGIWDPLISLLNGSLREDRPLGRRPSDEVVPYSPPKKIEPSSFFFFRDESLLMPIVQLADRKVNQSEREREGRPAKKRLSAP